MTRPSFRMVRHDFTGATPELTDNELRVGVALAHHADYETSVWEGTLDRFELICGWEKSRRTLQRTLHSFKAKGWIDFDVGERQRRPWVIRLTGLSIATASPTATPGAHSMSQSSASYVGDESAANDGAMQAGDASRLRHATATQLSSSTALRRGEDVLGVEDQGERLVREREQREKESGAARFDENEERELRAKTDQAFEAKGTSYVTDSANDIVEWNDRLPLRRYEREQDENAVSSELEARRASKQPPANEGNE